MKGDEDGTDKPLGIGEYLFAEMRQAFQDIRQKLVEEGWFGRVVTAAPVVEVDHALASERGGLYGDDHRPMREIGAAPAEHRPSFEDLWRPREGGEPTADHAQEHDIGMDR